MQTRNGYEIMIHSVIDTNVIVSALLSPIGNPSKIISLVSREASLQIYYSLEILNEYRRV